MLVMCKGALYVPDLHVPAVQLRWLALPPFKSRKTVTAGALPCAVLPQTRPYIYPFLFLLRTLRVRKKSAVTALGAFPPPPQVAGQVRRCRRESAYCGRAVIRSAAKIAGGETAGGREGYGLGRSGWDSDRRPSCPATCKGERPTNGQAAEQRPGR